MFLIRGKARHISLTLPVVGLSGKTRIKRLSPVSKPRVKAGLQTRAHFCSNGCWRGAGLPTPLGGRKSRLTRGRTGLSPAPSLFGKGERRGGGATCAGKAPPAACAAVNTHTETHRLWPLVRLVALRRRWDGLSAATAVSSAPPPGPSVRRTLEQHVLLAQPPPAAASQPASRQHRQQTARSSTQKPPLLAWSWPPPRARCRQKQQGVGKAGLEENTLACPRPSHSEEDTTHTTQIQPERETEGGREGALPRSSPTPGMQSKSSSLLSTFLGGSFYNPPKTGRNAVLLPGAALFRFIPSPANRKDHQVTVPASYVSRRSCKAKQKRHKQNSHTAFSSVPSSRIFNTAALGAT